MTDPTEDIPSDRPLGQSDRDLKLSGALGLGVAGTSDVGAVVKSANQFHRTVKGMEAAVPVVTDIHHAPADRAVTVENIKFPESEIRVLRPPRTASCRPPCPGEKSIAGQTRQEFTSATSHYLALLQTVDN